MDTAVTLLKCSMCCLQVIHQLIDKKQSEIRKVHPGLTCFGEGVRKMEVKDIPGICEEGGMGLDGGSVNMGQEGEGVHIRKGAVLSW